MIDEREGFKLFFKKKHTHQNDNLLPCNNMLNNKLMSEESH